VAVHLQLGGTRIATVRPPDLAGATAAFAEVLYYHRDYQGSVIGTSLRSLAADGLAGARYHYTPYGQLDKVDGVSAWTDSELGYTGGLRLGYVAGAVTTLAAPQAPGLVLLGARVYHPELKRWLVPDTVDPLRYTYTGGDPINFIDPSGRMMIDGHSWNLQSAPRVAFDEWFRSAPAGGLGLDIVNYPDLPWQQTVVVKAAGDQAPQVKVTSSGSVETTSSPSRIPSGVSLSPGSLTLDQSVFPGGAKQVVPPFLAVPESEGMDAGNGYHGAGECESLSKFVQNQHKNGHLAGDYSMPLGRAFFAPASGVVSSNQNEDGGNQVFLSANALMLKFGFAHASLWPGLSNGDWVRKGDFLAWSDGSGKGTVPHMHSTVRDGSNQWTLVNPSIYYGLQWKTWSAPMLQRVKNEALHGRSP
jgi:hypothetical protein